MLKITKDISDSKIVSDCQNCLTVAYFDLIYSRTTYSVNLWGHSSNAKEVFLLQRKTIRIIGLKFHVGCKNAFIELKKLTLATRYILECLVNIK